MSFYVEYSNRKDHRKPYRGSASFDSTCRPNGGCPYCYSNRTHSDRKRLLSAFEQLAEVEPQVSDRDYWRSGIWLKEMQQ